MDSACTQDQQLANPELLCNVKPWSRATTNTIKGSSCWQETTGEKNKSPSSSRCTMLCRTVMAGSAAAACRSRCTKRPALRRPTSLSRCCVCMQSSLIPNAYTMQ